MNLKSWSVLPLNKDRAAEIADRYTLPPMIAMLLQIRGADSEEKVLELLGRSDAFESPFAMKDMDKAVERIHRAIEEFEKISVYGDYDADGVTATSILYTYLQSVGADVMYYIPKREGEGYGMNMGAIESLSENEVSLIITVDNGISSVEEVRRAGELGIDVVITDHHRPQAKLPEAVAVVDPHRADCSSKFKDYAGAGLALKLVMALEWEVGTPDDILYGYSDLAALGTIGDVVPLLGENRLIVKQGLMRLQESDREGVQTLIEKAAVTKMTATSVAYSLVPRINATGRMGSPDRAVELLTTDYHEDAVVLAEDICKDNEQRREIEAKITENAVEMIENDPKLRYSRIIVVAGVDWHPGVLGIVAAKIMERYGKPVLILSCSGEEAKGSGRSFEGFSLFDAVSFCSDLLLRFGGHHMAAGVTLKSENIEALRLRLEQYAKQRHDLMPAQKLAIDCKLQPAALSAEIPNQLLLLEPYGSGNPYPMFGLFSMTLSGITAVGGGNHLRLNFQRDGVAVTCMRFGCKPEDFPYRVGTVLDLGVSLDAKEFRGAITLTVIVREMKPSAVNMDELLHSYRIYEKLKRLEPMGEGELRELTPTRADLADLYRTIRANGGWRQGTLQLLCDLPPHNISLGRLLTGLDILAERGLITLEGEELLRIELIQTEKKTDVFDSAVFATLQSLHKG